MAKETGPPIQNLRYKAGDLIFKEGDYGASIYKIVKGHANVIGQQKDREINLASLGPGDVFGEMIFLNNGLEPRASSVRALEDTEVESWHLARLKKEYAELPPILRGMLDQSLKRLLRMIKIRGRYLAEQQAAQKEGMSEPWASKRRFFRKEVNQECQYLPLAPKPGIPAMTGHIKDMSMGGFGIEIDQRNTINFSHAPGDEFNLKTLLPNGNEIRVKVKIISIKKDVGQGKLFMGTAITGISLDDRKHLGFYLMY